MTSISDTMQQSSTHTAHHDALQHWQQAGIGEIAFGVLPFVALLLMIAIFPLLPRVGHWWHQNRNKLLMALICGSAGVLAYLLPTGDWHTVLHTGVEYLAFISMLAALFVISGGIYFSGPFAGFPHVNAGILAAGAVLANLMGTTGASMLLIRPLLSANQPRKHKTHLMVFFIFIVANCGGLLTPLGDPPLYLGFLKGVPFPWTLSLWPQWLIMVGGLLLAFTLIDSWFFVREELETQEELAQVLQARAAGERLSVEGTHNFGFLAAVIAVIVATGSLLYPWLQGLMSTSNAELAARLIQTVILAALAFGAYRMTAPRLRQANNFSFEALNEVAVLFIGIFAAMIPALKILEAQATALPLNSGGQYFWATGLLSGVLDNAPTYLSFVTLAASRSGIDPGNLAGFAAQHPGLLAAISAGAVFMGALTYIGNGPNFMVKAMAEQAGIKMPSFGGYLLWSLSILLPMLGLIHILFYR